MDLNALPESVISSADVADVCVATILPAKSDSDAMLCLQSYQGFRIDRSPVY